MGLDDQAGESGVLQAATKHDPSGGVNPEWLTSHPENSDHQDSRRSGSGGVVQGLIALVLASAFLAFAILSW